MVMSSTPDKIRVILPFSRSLSTFSLKTSPSAHRPFCFLVDRNSKIKRADTLRRCFWVTTPTLQQSSAGAQWWTLVCRSVSRRWPLPRSGGNVSSCSSQSECRFSQGRLEWKKRKRLKRNRLILQPQTGGIQESDLCSGRQWLLQRSHICWGTSWRWSRLECSRPQRTDRDVRSRSRWSVWRRTSSY